MNRVGECCASQSYCAMALTWLTCDVLVLSAAWRDVLVEPAQCSLSCLIRPALVLLGARHYVVALNAVEDVVCWAIQELTPLFVWSHPLRVP